MNTIKNLKIVAVSILVLAGATQALAMPDDANTTTVGGNLEMNTRINGAVTTFAIGNANTTTTSIGTIHRGSHIGGNATMNTRVNGAVTTFAIGNANTTRTAIGSFGAD